MDRHNNRQVSRLCLTVFASALIALSGCGNTRSAQMAEVEPVEEVEEASAAGDPWMASNLIGAVDESTPVNVKDDYYLATMKEWLASVQVPSNLESWGSMDAREVEIEDDLMAVLSDESIDDKDVELLRTYVRINDGWDARDRLGMEPVRQMAQRIMDIDSMEDLADYLTSEEVRLWGNYLNAENGLQGEALIGLTPMVHRGREPGILVDTHRCITQEDLESDDELILEDDMAYLIGRLGVSEDDAYRYVDDMVDLELYLEDAQCAEGRYRDEMLQGLDGDLAKRIREAADDETYLVDMNRAELVQCAGDFPIEDLLDAYGYGEVDSFRVLEPLWLIGLGECCNADGLELLKAHLLVGLMYDAQYYLDTDAYYGTESYEDEYGDEEDIVDESRIVEVDEDTEYAYSLIDDAISEAPEIATNVYMKYCYAPKTTERVREICDGVLDSWRSLVEDTDWLSDESKREAVAKLDEMSVYVGSTTSLMDTDDITLEGIESPWEALYQIRKARTKYICATLLDPDMPDLWVSPIDVNAYYSNDNVIFVGCGYLGGELFDLDSSIEDQLAVVGHTVGHEVAHAFDGTGVLYDSKGNYRLWMSEEDQKAFDEREQRVRDYLDTIRPLGDTEYDGEKMSDEMIADMAGLKVVMRMAKTIDGFDYKRFFKSYCIGWKSVGTLSDLEDVLANDTHPLDATRANVSVMQVDEFSETYDVKPGDGMYMAPEDRISVW